MWMGNGNWNGNGVLGFHLAMWGRDGLGIRTVELFSDASSGPCVFFSWFQLSWWRRGSRVLGLVPDFRLSFFFFFFDGCVVFLISRLGLTGGCLENCQRLGVGAFVGILI